MTTPVFDEMQLSIRNRAGAVAGAIIAILVYLDAMVCEIWGSWAAPFVHAHAVVLPALVYFCWRTSRDGAYLARGSTARRAALLAGLVAAAQALSACSYAVRGQWLDDGRAGIFVGNVIFATTTTLIALFVLRSAAHERADD